MAQNIAVIITANTERKPPPRKGDLYPKLEALLREQGFVVEYDPGREKTTPRKDAKVWVGHSRGCDRLRFAPAGVTTIAVGSPVRPWAPKPVNHPGDQPDRVDDYDSLPDAVRQAHCDWHPSMREKILAQLPARTKEATMLTGKQVAQLVYASAQMRVPKTASVGATNILENVGGLASTVPIFAMRFGTMKDDDIDPEHRTGAVLGSLGATMGLAAVGTPFMRRALAHNTDRWAAAISKRHFPQNPRIDRIANTRRVLDMADMGALDSAVGQKALDDHGADIERLLGHPTSPKPSNRAAFQQHLLDNRQKLRARVDEIEQSPENFLAQSFSKDQVRAGVNNAAANVAMLPAFWAAHEVGSTIGQAGAEETHPTLSTRVRRALGEPTGLARLTAPLGLGD